MSDVESKAGQAIAQKMEQIEPGTPRYEALEMARRFKTSWVELGSKLWQVRNDEMYKNWGFRKFEDYCRDEIRIKPRTASKLTASYYFLKKEEPAVLQRDGVEKPIPDVQVIDMLRRMHAKEELPEKEYRKIKEMAFDDVPVASLKREIRQHKPSEPPSRAKMITTLLNQANKLADALAEATGIPHRIVDRALSLVTELRALVEN